MTKVNVVIWAIGNSRRPSKQATTTQIRKSGLKISSENVCVETKGKGKAKIVRKRTHTNKPNCGRSSFKTPNKKN